MARSVLFSLPGKMWRRHLLPPQPTALSLSRNPHMGPASSPVKRTHSSPVALLAFLEGQWGPPSSDESCGAQKMTPCSAGNARSRLHVIYHGPLRRSQCEPGGLGEQDLLAAVSQDISLYKDGIS